MARCLVTGHKGYIGSRLVKQLELEGHEVLGIDLIEDIPKDIKFVSARVAGRLFMASAALSTQQSTGTVSTNIADNTTDSQFQLVKSERLGDYQAEYESVLDQMNQEVLNASDKQILSKYKKQYFTSAGLLD